MYVHISESLIKTTKKHTVSQQFEYEKLPWETGETRKCKYGKITDTRNLAKVESYSPWGKKGKR